MSNKNILRLFIFIFIGILICVLTFSVLSYAADTFSSDSIPINIIDQEKANTYLSNNDSQNLCDDKKAQTTDLQGECIEGTYRSVNKPNDNQQSNDNILKNVFDGIINYQSDVTDDMCTPNYWSKLAINPDRILKSKNEILQINNNNMSTPETYMTNLKQNWQQYDGNKLKQSLLDMNDFFDGIKAINGEELPKEIIDVYYQNIQNNISLADTTDKMDVVYSVATHNAYIKICPTDDLLMDGADDAVDENQNSSICVNEPFVIKLFTKDKKFAYGCSDNCYGWVNTDYLVDCNNRNDWLNCWDIDINAKNFLVVTADRIYLEESFRDKDSSKLMLPLGTILRLVPKDEIPTHVYERATWNNYVVYIPTKNASGKLENKMCLISQHCDVSIGFLPLTQRNLLNVAYNNLGDRYGWGNMLSAFDCSGLLKNVYRCFGFTLPRNTTWQSKIPNYSDNITNLSREEKQVYLNSLPAGTILVFSEKYGYSHEVMYLGHVGNKYYILHDSGILCDCNGDLYTPMSVVVTSLDVTRWNSDTPYIDCLGFSLNFKNVNLSTGLDCGLNILEDNINYTGSPIKPNFEVKDGDSALKEGVNYTTQYFNNVDAGTATIKITAINYPNLNTGYTGSIEKSFTISKAQYEVESSGYNGIYDGSPHSIKINNIKTGSKVLFNIEGTNEWSDKNPARITPGETVVNYRIEHQNYKTITGKQAITIKDNTKVTENVDYQDNVDYFDNLTSTNDLVDIYTFAGVLIAILIITTSIVIIKKHTLKNK